MPRYESIDRPGVFGYSCCPNCGGTSYRNSWHDTNSLSSIFGLQCVNCGELGSSGRNAECPMLFVPDNQEKFKDIINPERKDHATAQPDDWLFRKTPCT